MDAKKGASGSSPATACAEYSFRQRFRVPAGWAFRWCIDYSPDDWKTTGAYSSRAVDWRGPRTVVLDDALPGPGGDLVHKVKIVQIYPRTREWVSTHIEGPRLHSQFRYTISPDGPSASVLRFEGRELSWTGSPLSHRANARLSQKLRAEDSGLWKKLAKEMERDYRER